MHQTYSKKLLYSFLFLFFVQLNYAQLSDFTLNVTKTDETCTGNGSLSFTLSNSTAGATFIYSIYRLPNTTTPIVVTNDTTFSGLISGTYLVVATQSLGNESGSQQQEVTIENQTAVLTYVIAGHAEICGGDGAITITTLTGTASSYEIFLGPIIRPLQTSNQFTGLIAGQYTIRVFDICGEAFVQTYTVAGKNPALVVETLPPASVNCELVIGIHITTVVPDPNGAIKFPLQIVATITPPVGSPVVTNYNVNYLTDGLFTITTPFFSPQPYSYSFQITDGCGVVYTVEGIVDNIYQSISVEVLNFDCTTQLAALSGISGLVLISAPDGYPYPLPEDFTAQIVNHSFTSEPLSIMGHYIYQAVDICGNTQTVDVYIPLTPPPPPYAYPFEVSCDEGSLVVFNVTSVVLTGAPSSYTGPLPYDFSSSINTAGIAVLHDVPLGAYTFFVETECFPPTEIHGLLTTEPTQYTSSFLQSCVPNGNVITVKASGPINSIVLTSAPSGSGLAVPVDYTPLLEGLILRLENMYAGNYIFTITDSCGIVTTFTVNIPFYQQSLTVNAIQNCGSFDIDLHQSDNSGVIPVFFLQKYYPTAHDWGHPGTGVLQGANMPSSQSGRVLTNNSLNLNFVYSGQFRIVKHQNINTLTPNTSVFHGCIDVIYEFEAVGLPEIIEVHSVSCDNTYEVEVIATGIGPLTYKITTKNGLPFLIDNADSPVFTNLSPAIYNFRVSDACGNIVNSVFEINLPNPLEVTPANLCLHELATLTVPSFSFLTYEWWNNANPSAILSTTNSLTFPDFDANASNGTYSVRVTYAGNPNSCLNTVKSYAISVDGFYPNAGDGKTLTYCGNPTAIDLFTLLQGSYDTTGVWTVLTGNTILNASNWDSSVVAPDVYQFSYHVNGNCGAFDETNVAVTIKAIPEVPEASTNPVICESQEINLFASTIPDATYQWTGPANFSSTDQNPVIHDISAINSGTYTVKTILEGCESAPDQVELVVSPVPAFILQSKCEDGRYTVSASPVNNSFDINNVTYAWTGPNGYTNAINPIDITRLPVGEYALTVTDGNGCGSMEVITVPYTVCEIPNVITPNGDGLNTNFDLSGLDVIKLEIYNRWGRKVYEKNEYLDEWHGQNMHGGQLPDSTYYYYIQLRTNEERVGWVFVNGS